MCTHDRLLDWMTDVRNAAFSSSPRDPACWPWTMTLNVDLKCWSECWHWMLTLNADLEYWRWTMTLNTDLEWWPCLTDIEYWPWMLTLITDIDRRPWPLTLTADLDRWPWPPTLTLPQEPAGGGPVWESPVLWHAAVRRRPQQSLP